MVLAQTSDSSFLQHLSRNSDILDAPSLEEVAIDTIDRFCSNRSIDRINYLKIDTEGGDLEVLRGAEAMLSRQCVDLIQVEAGMNRTNRIHVPISHFTAFLEERNYFLFGIYDQMNEFQVGKPNLRRTNPVFMSARLIEANSA